MFPFHEYDCETVCDGKHFWLQHLLNPRKCTQSSVQLCHRRAVHSDATEEVVVRKRFLERPAYEKEKEMLARCKQLGTRVL